jgi:hypothetical protein
MPPNDQWLQDRKFQERLLAALEGPKKHWFIRLVNSAAFLWLATLLLVIIGGGFLTNHQQCVREADLLLGRRDRIAQELLTRKEAIGALIQDSGSVEEIRSGLNKLPYAYIDLHGLTFLELDRELALIEALIDASADVEDSASPEPPSDIPSHDMIALRGLYEGIFPVGLTNGDLPSFKESARIFRYRVRWIPPIHRPLVPNCGLKNTLLLAAGIRGVKTLTVLKIPPGPHDI